jgi:hypothetical protein
MLWSMGHHQHRIPLFTGEFVALVNVIYTLHAGDHRSRRTKTPVLWDFTDPDISTSEDTLQPSVNLFMFILLSFPFVTETGFTDVIELPYTLQPLQRMGKHTGEATVIHCTSNINIQEFHIRMKHAYRTIHTVEYRSNICQLAQVIPCFF